MLALAVVLATTTTIGPDLVQGFTVPLATGARTHIVIVGDDVITAQGSALERRSLRDGAVGERTELPCDVVDLTSYGDVIGVLCADRVLSANTRKGLGGFTERRIDDEGAPPLLLALRTTFDVFVVAFEDGLLVRGRFGSDAKEMIDLRARPLAMHITGIDDVDVALADGTAHRWRFGRVEPAVFGSALGAQGPDLLEVFVDAQGARHARISRGVVTSASAAFADGTQLALSMDPRAFAGAVDAIALGHDRACLTTSSALVCFAARALTIPVRDERGAAPWIDEATPATAADVAVADVDATSAGALAAYGSMGLGVGVLASAPFVMSALSPSAPFGAAAAIAGLGGVAGVASFAIVGSAAIVVVGGVLAIMQASAPSSFTGTGFLDQIARDIGNAIDECMCALMTIAVAAAAIVGAAAIGVAWLSVSAMPAVDVALGGRAPASDPFWPALGGAAVGSVVGYGLGAAVSLLTAPLRDGEDGDAQDELAIGLDAVQVAVHVVAAGAVGASIGYGLARGP